MPIKFLLLLFNMSLFSLFCFSQNNVQYKTEPVSHNNRFYSISKKQATELYKNKLENNYTFLNGKEYKLYDITKETNPLFHSSFGLNGTVFVNGETYKNLKLAYDIYKDKLIYITPVQLFENYNFFELNQATIDSFYIEVKETDKIHGISGTKQYCFSKVDFSENENSGMKDGYYEVAKVGNTKLFVQHKALRTTSQGADGVMQQSLYRYYHVLNKTLLINGTYYEINKKRKFIKLFPDKRKAINRKLRKFELKFELLNKEQMVELLRVINSI